LVISNPTLPEITDGYEIQLHHSMGHDLAASRSVMSAADERAILSALEPAATGGIRHHPHCSILTGIQGHRCDYDCARDYPQVAPKGRQEAESSKAKRLAEKFAQLVRGPAEQAEPAAAYTIDYLGCEHVSRDVESIERSAANGSHGPTEVVYLYEHPDAVTEDTKLLDTLRSESWDLRCFDIPTGGDDSDIGWRVIGHWQAEPCERVVAEVYYDDPRAALKAAMEAGR